MYIPQININNKNKNVQIEFKGLNKNYFVGENQFSRMKNMTSTYYPVLSPRNLRKKYSASYSNIEGLSSVNGKLVYVDNGIFYYNGVEHGRLEANEKQIVIMGAYVVVFPDKKAFNTSSMKWENLEAAFETVDDIHYSIVTKDGDDYNVSSVSVEPPQEPQNGDLWIDISDTPHILKQYSSSAAMWVSIPTVYTKIASNGIGSAFSEFDGVEIIGSEIENFDGSYIIQKAEQNYIIVTALLDELYTQDTSLRIERKVPDMDFVCELNNRIWGCNSNQHEIYACKLGDPKNWYSYAGISTDSYAMTCGSDGDFTGCISHLGYVLFFKEDIIHKIYGSKPANFQLTDVHARGVEKGSEGSLCIVNETLYYKSRDGVCAYDGALPIEVSSDLGIERYHNANAGALGNKYFISMFDAEEKPHMFVYDESKQVWHEEDNTYAKYFTRLNGGLYYVTQNEIWGIDGSETMPGMSVTNENEIDWYFETGEILYNYIDRRYVSRINVRLTLEKQSKAKVYIQYDNGAWKEVKTLIAQSRKTHLIPIIPRRSETVRIKIAGTGDCKIFAVSKELEIGSDI